MTIIESHNIDKSDQFIHLYNQCYTEQQIKQKMNIGKTAYYNYYKQNQHKLKRTKKCQICGKTFTPKTPKQKYCTQECQKQVKYYQKKEK